MKTQAESCKVAAAQIAVALGLCLTGSIAQAATLTVTSGGDSGAGTLRNAIASATAGDSIAFSGVSQVQLASQLTLSKDITINGAGVTLDGRLKGRVLKVNPGVTATLTGLAITNGLLAATGINWNGATADGSSWGAGILNNGNLTLNGVQVVGNYATGGGAGGTDGTSSFGGGGGGGGVGVGIGGSSPLKGRGGNGGIGNDNANGATFPGGAGATDTPTGGEGPDGLSTSGSNGGGGTGGTGYFTGNGGGGGGGGWAGGGGAAGPWGAGGGGYRGGVGGFNGAGTGGGSGGSGGASSAGGDASGNGGGYGGGGGYATLNGISIGGGGGAAGNSGSNGGAAAGGIYNAAGATLTILGTGCSIARNLAAGGGGSGYRYGGQAVGGLWNAGALQISSACQSAVTDNAAGAGRDGQGSGPNRSDNNLRSDVSLQVQATGSGNVSAGILPTPVSGSISNCTNATCTATYTSNDGVILTATAQAGNALTGWSGAVCASGSSTQASCQITMSADQSLSANFSPFAITPPGSLVSTYGTPYSQAVHVSGGVGPMSYSVPANSPAGLTLSTDGTISGAANLASGTYSLSITASDANSASTLPQTVNVTINPASTSTTLTLSSATPVFSESVTLSAQVPLPAGTSGTVQFLDGTASPIAGCSAVPVSSGTAQCSTSAWSVGVHSVSAVYTPADSNTMGSTSATVTATVTKATPVVALTPPGNLIVGQPTTVLASVTAPGVGTPSGLVTISGAGGTCSATLASSGTASCALTPTAAASSSTFTASYAGDGNFNAASNTANASVTGGATSVSLTSSLNPSVPGADVTFTVTVSPLLAAAISNGAAIKTLSTKATSVPSGTVTLTDNGAPLGSITLVNGTATFSTSTLSAGAHAIVATYGGDPQNAGASMRFTQSVGAATVNPVPTLSQWGLVLLGSVLAMFGVPALRRKGGQR